MNILKTSIIIALAANCYASDVVITTFTGLTSKRSIEFEPSWVFQAGNFGPTAVPIIQSSDSTYNDTGLTINTQLRYNEAYGPLVRIGLEGYRSNNNNVSADEIRGKIGSGFYYHIMESTIIMVTADVYRGWQNYEANDYAGNKFKVDGTDNGAALGLRSEYSLGACSLALSISENRELTHIENSGLQLKYDHNYLSWSLELGYTF